MRRTLIVSLPFLVTGSGLALFAIAERGLRLPGCPLKAVTGLDCPGCGATRACEALLEGDLVRALDHNVLLIPAVLVLLAIWGAAVRSRRSRIVDHPRSITVTVAVAGAFMLLRNLPFLPYLAAGG